MGENKTLRIDGHTRLVGIFGYPVEHTLSPVLQNAAFAARNLNFVYLPYLVKPEHLFRAVSSIRALNMVGVNVTIPHKEAVVEFLDELHASAKIVGAVNTIHYRNNKLTGYNTDGKGFLDSLIHEGKFSPSGKKAVLLGSGGVARALAAVLAEQGIKKLTIANRTPKKAEILASRLKRFFSIPITVTGLNSADLNSAIEEADILLNATSVGMSLPEKILIHSRALHRRLFVYDVVYQDTPLLRAAKKIGAKTLNGMGMLIYQGAESFEIWTGKKAPLEAMRQALELQLQLASRQEKSR
ncbi:MAG: shikimate dehydrogenase [Elusimicrobiota bacterium]